jgi:hypothetical protein
VGSKPEHSPSCCDTPDKNDADATIGTYTIDDGYIKNVPYFIGFEDGFGDWKQNDVNDFDWVINTGSTPSCNTGPDTAYEGSNYIYMESSSPNYPYKQAIIKSPGIDLTNCCDPYFKFNYHMYGSTMGFLLMQIITSDYNCVYEIELYGSQGDE